MRILIAEDDRVLADGLLRSLRALGYAVDQVADGNSADAALQSSSFDLLILDLGLPRLSGFEVLRKLRARGTTVPVLILTAADSVEDKVRGLDLGADDYMAKPFALQELEARVRALSRRGMGGASAIIQHGPLQYDITGRVVTLDGHVVELSARELTLLEVLLQRAGRLVSKDQLVEHLCVWGEEVSTNAIEVYVHRLRKKIEVGPVRIATVRGLGYCLEKIAPMPDISSKETPSRREGKRGQGRHPRSLFGEILDWMLAPMLLLWPLSIGITYLVAQAIAAKPYDAALEHTLRQLAAQVQAQGAQGAVRSALWQQTLHQPPAGGILGYQVRSASGVLLAGAAGLPSPAILPPGHAAGSLSVVWRDGEMGGHSVRLAAAWVWPPAAAGTPRAVPVLVQVAQSMDARTRLARDIVQGVILPQFVVVPIFILLVWFGLGQGIAPLNELQARIRRRRADDISPIDEREAPEEIAPLVDSINSLFARLQQSLQTQKRFVADAAHQIKTPLAGLRMQAELAQRETDPEELRASLRQIGRSVERTTRLVNQLLALTRAENQGGAARAVFETIDLRQPAAEAMQELAMLALDKNLELEFDSPPLPLQVRGNALLLQELIKNLLHNAITYTPPGGSVTLRLRGAVAEGPRAGPVVQLQVDDSGPGIPETERALVFEPFYRILDNGSEGSGLGLAIVREIARQHDAEITLGDLPQHASGKGQGLRVQAQFARAGGPAAPR